MTQTQLIIVALQILALTVGGLVAYYAFVVKVNSRLTIIESWIESKKALRGTEKIEDIEEVLHRLQADNEVFWKVIAPHLANIIHSPVHRNRDDLVEKLVCGTLERGEVYTLVTELRMALDDPVWPADKKLAAAMLLARVLTTYGRLEEPYYGTPSVDC